MKHMWIWTGLYWLASSFCLFLVGLFWGRDIFWIGLAVAVIAEIIACAVAKMGGLRLALRGAISLLVIWLLAVAWGHIVIRYFTNL